MESHPLRMRGLKLPKTIKYKETRSHPLRMRGLKQAELKNKVYQESSHPLRMRGLKLLMSDP